MSFLDHLNWRFAAKTFDPTKKVSDQDLHNIKDAIQMAPTSFGLQPFEVKIITDQATKEALLPHSWNQPQITTCSHLLVFCSHLDFSARINEYFETASEKNTDLRITMKGYEDMMNGYFSDKDQPFVQQWADNQTHIALGFAMAACSELEVDSCAIGGFIDTEYNKVLDLPAHLNTTVVLPIGYRVADPEKSKVRLSEEIIFT